MPVVTLSPAAASAQSCMRLSLSHAAIKRRTTKRATPRYRCVGAIDKPISEVSAGPNQARVRPPAGTKKTSTKCLRVQMVMPLFAAEYAVFEYRIPQKADKTVDYI